MKNLKCCIYLWLIYGLSTSFATPVVNVYAWGGEIPKSVIQQFEARFGIHVNFSTYDSNETMFAKLKASRTPIYDVILPSAYFVERMQKQGMLHPLPHKQLPNLVNLDERFIHNDFDKGNRFSVPIIWGASGIFYNRAHVATPPTHWRQLWNPLWKNQLLLLDDPREIFAIALLSLGFSPNDNNPLHIKRAYEHLRTLVPNIKLFASDSVQAIIIDEDAVMGEAWNGDAFKAQKENEYIDFIYPDEGYVIWVDCLAIPKNPPHLGEALRFINFLLEAEVSKEIALAEGHAITNAKGRVLLPIDIRNNQMVYPSADTLKKAYFQRDVGEEALALMSHYWEQLKLAF